MAYTLNSTLSPLDALARQHRQRPEPPRQPEPSPLYQSRPYRASSSASSATSSPSSHHYAPYPWASPPSSVPPVSSPSSAANNNSNSVKQLNPIHHPSPQPPPLVKSHSISALSFHSIPDDSSHPFPPPRMASPTPSQSISQRAVSPSPSTTSYAQHRHNPSANAFAKAKAAAYPASSQAQHDFSDPNVCLQLGIKFHESGQLARAAYYFERSAKERGGCGPGMLLWGLTLRHGWGCHANPSLAFSFFQKAAESVVDDIDNAVNNGGLPWQGDEKDRAAKAAKFELVLSIYELGQCFYRGWGVTKDKKMALKYYELAASLGDPDAQMELGFCYTNGKGCKRDKKKAAKYYRMAAKQGVEMFGMQWIHKSKYDE